MKNGHTKSCGCINKKLAALNNSKRHAITMNNKVLDLPSDIILMDNSVPGVIFLSDDELNNIENNK